MHNRSVADVKSDPKQNEMPGSFTVTLSFLEFPFSNLKLKLDLDYFLLVFSKT